MIDHQLIHFPSKKENVKLWEDFVDKALRTGPFKELKDNVSKFLKEKGLEGLDDRYFVYKYSPYLNIYGYPKELDYQEEKDRKLPGNWLRFVILIFDISNIILLNIKLTLLLF